MKKRISIYEREGVEPRKDICNNRQENSQKIQRLLRRKFNKQISIIREANNKISQRGGNMPGVRTSEVLSYRFILNELEALGWNIRNPLSSSGGQVFTQRQCLDDLRIKEQLNQLHPENIIKLSENEFYVIEAKRTREMVDIAIGEAEKDYANLINKSKKIKALIISGVGGNEIDGYLVKSKFLEKGKWKTITINKKELTGLVSPEIARLLLEQNKADIDEIPVNEKLFLETAERINAILHEGGIIKDYRARVMACLLLALSEDAKLNLEESPRILVNSINARVNAVLQREGKPNFYQFIAIDLPSSTENHVKFKQALVLTIQELLNLNIRSAMNSGTDVLGKFYEVFLKYGNGAKEIGIVLTPRHITKFSAEAIDVNKNDIILDPACGTGGFLVSAFDLVKKNSKEEEIKIFKENNIFGIEQQDGIVALAIVNMIFRGDGKNNIIEGDCFKNYLNLVRKNGVNTAEYKGEDSEDRIKPISKVLMNPPFALKKSDEKEYKFIEHGLKQMQDRGLLFSVLPTSNMVKSGGYLRWRKDSLLRENTLLCVVTFPNDLFYPVGVETCGIFVKKGIPHPRNQKVLWVKIKSDGFLKSKGKRLPSDRVNNEIAEVVGLIKQFIKNPNTEVKNIKEFQKACEIDFEDRNLELLPEVYLDEKKPTDTELKQRVDKTIRDLISLIVKFDKLSDFKRNVNIKEILSKSKANNKTDFNEIPITDLFETPIKTGKYHKSGALDEGKTPLVSCVSDNGGFEGFFDIERENILENNVTIASDGMPLTSFYHFYPFTAKDNVLIGKPTRQYKFTTLLFITTQLNALRWRFSYGRKCYENKAHKIKIFLPMKDEEIDEDYIENLFKSLESWEILEKIIK
jgi:type I restriction-modification system DNA methylase subunit